MNWKKFNNLRELDKDREYIVVEINNKGFIKRRSVFRFDSNKNQWIYDGDEFRSDFADYYAEVDPPGTDRKLFFVKLANSDRLSWSIFCQANRYEVKEDSVEFEFSNEMKFFEEWLGRTESLWWPVFVDSFGDKRCHRIYTKEKIEECALE